MAEIRIVYVDDQNDEILSRYVSQVYCSHEYNPRPGDQAVHKIYNEIKFDGTKGYEYLIQDTRIRSANVVLIDNHLFEERTAATGKFSGKQFKVILRKLFPFIEVIIITQDATLVGENVIRKFSDRHGSNPDVYYNTELAPLLDAAIMEVLDFEALADDLVQSADVEKMLIDKIVNSLKGDNSYDSLTKSDIDSLIASFKELKDGCSNERL